MTDRLTILFPSDYFDNNKVDDSFKKEYDAALSTGLYDAILFSYDEWVDNGAIILNRIPEERRKVIYRGWMIKPDIYNELWFPLSQKNIDLVISWYDYKYLHEYPNIYPTIEEDTTKMMVFPEGEIIDINLIREHFDRFMIKDYVKSVKGSQFPKCFSSDITQEELDGFLEQFRKFRGNMFTGGICIKEYIDLKHYGEYTNEYRVFYVRGQVISVCRNSLQQPFTPEPPKELIEKYQYLRSPFYTIDFAEKEDGNWIIIEAGDGQVSGLSEGQDPEAFYRALYQAMTRPLEWRWCLVGNIVETREYGENHEIRHGTKHFSGGTKVYLAPAQWGDGYENVVMIGKPRFKRGFIEIVLRLRYATNFRLQKVYSPTLLHRMEESEYWWWGNTDADRDCINSLAESLNEEDPEDNRKDEDAPLKNDHERESAEQCFEVVSVTFDGGYKTYDYFCDINGVKPGDKVIVEANGNKVPVTVHEVKNVRESDLSLPIHQYKYIEGHVETMNKWFIVKKESDYLKEFLEMFWEFHDFRIKKIIYNMEKYSVDVVLEYDTPDEMNDVLLRFVNVISTHVNCNIDYETDWISGASLCMTEDNHLLWCNDEELTDIDEVRKSEYVTYVESEEIRFALVDQEGKPLDYPDTMLHQTWRVLNYETMKYEIIKKDFHVFEAESSD